MELQGGMKKRRELYKLMERFRKSPYKSPCKWGWRFDTKKVSDKTANIILNVKIEICDSQNIPTYYPMKKYYQNFCDSFEYSTDVKLVFPEFEFGCFMNFCDNYLPKN